MTSWAIICSNQRHRSNNVNDASNVISIKKTHRSMWASEKAIDFAKQLNLDEIDNINSKLGNYEVHIDCVLNDIQSLFKSTADNILGRECEYEMDINKKYKPIKFYRHTLNIRNKYWDARSKKTDRVSATSKAYKKAVAKAKAIARKKK